MKKKLEHLVKTVEQGSIAEELEIAPGDVLLTINDQEIEDVFDYRYLIKDENLVLLVRKPDGEEWELEIEKDEDDDLGIEFENGLMSDFRSCSNKCIFCFIDQMPPNMRDTLYFKDDDSRLSFLSGNYITLTNMQDRDVERIIRMKLAPINISVHTTDPALRCKMLHNRFAGEKLHYLQKLFDGHVEMNGQIVCCKGVNDGEELRRTIHDLTKYLPFMRSVSVVPAGITRYRQGLYPLELFDKEESGRMIDLVESFQQELFERYGLHFVHCSDEWYINAERPFPEEARYDGYIQLENGVGMMRLLIDEFDEAMRLLTREARYPQLKSELHRTLTIATGKLAYPTIAAMAARITEALPQVAIHVVCIRNDFFGETITVSGLITGQDLVAQVKALGQTCDVGDTLLIPSNMLRMGEQVFLDDMTVEEAEAALGMKLVAVDSRGRDFLAAVTDAGYAAAERAESEVYFKAYDNGEDGR